MKRKILTLAVTITFSITLCSQSVNFTTKFDSIFKVKFDTISTGILYNRVANFADLEKHANIVDTINLNKFIQAYSELKRAVVNKSVSSFHKSVTDLKDISYYKLDTIIPIGIIYSDFNIIDTNAFHNNRLVIIDSVVQVNNAVSYPIFSKKSIFMGSPLINSFDTLTIKFSISNNFCFQNVGSNLIKLLIDFNNDNGFVTYNLNSNFNYTPTITYTTYGEKTIIIKGINISGDTLTTITKITISQKTEPKDNIQRQDIEFWADIPFKEVYGKGEVRIFYANNDNLIRKPILIVDGFDPGDERVFETGGDKGTEIWGMLKYEYYNNSNKEEIHLGEELIARGYDVILLNFPTILMAPIMVLL